MIKKIHNSSNKKIDFLFVSYGGGHLKALLPIAKRLIKDGYEVQYFALTSAVEILKKTTVPFFSYKDLDASNEPSNIELGRKLAAEHETVNNKKNTIGERETTSYLSLNYIDIVDQLGKKEARKRWLREGRQMFYPLKLMTKILKSVNPRMVISTNSPRSEKASIDAASELGINSVCINDLFATQESAWLKDKNFGDKIFVLNSSVKDFLVKKGRPQKDIIVSGNPAFDSLYERRFLLEGLKIKKDMGLNEKINILYASTEEQKINIWTGEKGDVRLPKKIESVLRDYVKSRENVNLIIRRHPNQEQFVKAGKRVFMSDQEQNINSILNAVDIVIHSASTVGLQAALIGKSVINIELSTIAKDLPLTSMGLGKSVFSLDDLSSAIDNEIKSYGKEKNKKKDININACETIVEEILKILK